MPYSGGSIRFLETPAENQSLRVRYCDQGEGLPLLFLHGWGCTFQIFDPLRENLKEFGRHVAVDFPGFGESSLPPSAWDTQTYADWLYDLLQILNVQSCIVVTHSFGGRVALRLARKHPEVFKAMILIASAGLKRRVHWKRRLRVKTIRGLARLAAAVLPASIGLPIKERLYNKIASRDYQNAGELRPILVKAVNEDQSESLPHIKVPALLIYGSEDTETPPAVGKRIAELLPNAQYVELPGFDHLSILDRGRHQVEHQIRQFLKGVE